MNIMQIYNRFKASEKMFRCPACAMQMAFRNENSFVCSNGHCFDLSKHGYINFLPNQGRTKYSKTLFESRRLIFQSGFYDPLKESIESLCHEYADTASPVHILDAGCGEGFFTPEQYSDTAQAYEIFAMDILKDAIVLAAKENNNIKWMVGDLSNIPLQSDAVHILLNIFAPASYQEFLRVMKDNGLIIKVIPGKKYLIELRECAKGQLNSQDYSNESVLHYFHKNMIGLGKKHLYYQLPVTPCHVENLIQMTPMMFHVDKTRLHLDEIRQITIDVEILVGKKPE